MAKKNIVSRAEMIKYIKERLQAEHNLEVSKEIIKAVLETEEEEIYTLIAENKSYYYLWGRIGGEEKPPVKVSGKFSEIKSVKENHGYSTWKNGYPYINWSKITKVYDIHPPEEYFELPENRYTTAAREFRQDANLPEIPEYEGLSEEKILEYCAKADEIKIESMKSIARSKKKRDNKFNKIKTIAVHEYWEKNNYIPFGRVDKHWTGPTLDRIDMRLKEYYVEDDSTVNKLEKILNIKDYAEFNKELSKHPEIEEIEQQLRQELEQQGLQPLPHKKRDVINSVFDLQFKGEDDPWGIKNTTVVAELTKQRKQRLDQSKRDFKQELINDMKKVEEDIAKDGVVKESEE